MNLKVKAKLDPGFEPLSLVVREMREATKEGVTSRCAHKSQ